MTIPEMGQKLKFSGLRELLVPAIVVLVGVLSFVLGRLSAAEANRPGLSIIYPANYADTLPAAAAGTISGQTSTTGGMLVVASKNGTKYFFPDCTGAKAISDKNKITFASAAEARAAGYLPAANCKGLQ